MPPPRGFWPSIAVSRQRKLVVRLENGETTNRLAAMDRLPRRPTAFSKVSVKSQTVIPREVRQRLKLKPGDTLRYRMTDDASCSTRRPNLTTARSSRFRNGHPKRTRRPMADCRTFGVPPRPGLIGYDEDFRALRRVRRRGRTVPYADHLAEKAPPGAGHFQSQARTFRTDLGRDDHQRRQCAVVMRCDDHQSRTGRPARAICCAGSEDRLHRTCADRTPGRTTGQGNRKGRGAEVKRTFGARMKTASTL